MQPKRRCEFLCRGLAVLVPHSHRYQIVVRGPSLIGESLLAPLSLVFFPWRGGDGVLVAAAVPMLAPRCREWGGVGARSCWGFAAGWHCARLVVWVIRCFAAFIMPAARSGQISFPICLLASESSRCCVGSCISSAASDIYYSLSYRCAWLGWAPWEKLGGATDISFFDFSCIGCISSCNGDVHKMDCCC